MINRIFAILLASVSACATSGNAYTNVDAGTQAENSCCNLEEGSAQVCLIAELRPGTCAVIRCSNFDVAACAPASPQGAEVAQPAREPS